MTSAHENNLKQVLKSNECEPTNFRNNCHSFVILENLQSLRKYVDDDFTFIQNKKTVTHFCF